MTLAQKAAALTDGPGVYLMKDKSGKIIYVGKAKNLKRRVYSYFSAPERHEPKTAAMVSHVRDFETIVAATELEALLLENNLIKKHQPKYNILLKDDKGYPYIRITDAEYPRLELARRADGGGGEYFGPFYGSRSARSIIEAAERAFLLPSCRTPEPSPGRRPCLNYRIKRCCGLCAGLADKRQYADLIEGAREFLKGDVESVRASTLANMERASESMEYERAAVLRDRLRAIDSILEKQRVATDPSVTGDYAAVLTQGAHRAAVILSVERGIMTGKTCYIADLDATDGEAEFGEEYIKRYYGDLPQAIPSRVVCDPLPEDREAVAQYLSSLAGRRVQIIRAVKTGDREIVRMAQANAREEIIQREGRIHRHERQLFALAGLLGLEKLDLIEVYDISHTAGSDVVCGMAVYGSSGFVKAKYRRFKLDEATAGDDCACLAAAAARRFARYCEGDEGFMPLPDAIFADGGAPQLRAIAGAAARAGLSLPVYGLKKDRNHKTKALVFPDGGEVMLYKHPDIFPLCGTLQEEAHRFAIEYHGVAARKRMLSSALCEIEGVGKSRAVALVAAFGTTSAMKKATQEQIAGVKGISEALAGRIYEYLHSGEV